MIERNRLTRFFLGHQVADPAHGMDLHRGTGVGQHLAQPVNVDLHRIRADIARQPEQVVFEQALGGHIAAAPEQDLEHRCFAGGEGPHRAVDDHLPPLGIERHVAEGQAPAEQVAGAAQQGLQAGDQLFHGERLGHVVVGPLAQARDPIAHPVAGRQHQHRCRNAALAQVAQQAQPVVVGEAKVEHDGSVPHGRQDVCRIAGGAHRIG